MRFLVILLSASILTHTSPYELIKALRTWKLPEILITVLSFTILFLKQIQFDLYILNQNLKKRNICLNKIPWKDKFELTSILIIPIIGKLFADIKFKAIAMELNGYGFYKKSSIFFYKKTQVADYLLMVIFFTILICIFIY